VFRQWLGPLPGFFLRGDRTHTIDFVFDRFSRRRFIALATAAASGALHASTTRIDPDGALALDGQRVFPLGLYQLPPVPDAHRQARAAGFSILHCAPTAEALDAASRHGLRAWITAGSDPAKITDLVQRFAAHPALLFWETEDEPSFQWKKPGPRVSPERMRAAYALLKKLDPDRPVYLNHSPTNLVSTLQTYNPGGDIIATDVYPVIPHGIREQYALWPDGRHGDFLNTHVSQVGQYADKMRQVAGPNRAMWMVLQAFSWEMLRKDGGRDPKMVLYPTAGQLRFMAWQSIVHGANGLLWWGLEFTPATSPLWGDLQTVAREILRFEASLAGKTERVDVRLEYRDTGHSLDRGIEWIAKPDPGRGRGFLWVAVNADPNPVEADTGLQVREAAVGPEPVSGSILRLPPFGVAVWRVGK
jgi:hypothetical protein